MFSKIKLNDVVGLRNLMNEQMTQWSEMVERHKREKCALQEKQATQLQVTLMTLMENVHATQVKQLKLRHVKYDSLYI